MTPTDTSDLIAALDPVVKVARDLTEITLCRAELRAQAIADGANPDLPGGPAMVALGPVADLETWLHLADTTAELADHPDEHRRRVYTSVEDEDDDENRWPPQQVIAYWAGRWRTIRGEDYADMRRTADTETNYLRELLGWALEHEPEWDRLAADIRRARITAENLVARGRRADRSRIVCDRPTCETHPRLVRAYSPRYLTGWTCRTCNHHTPAAYRCADHGHPSMPTAQRCTRMVGRRDDRHVCSSRIHPVTQQPAACTNPRCADAFNAPAPVHASDAHHDRWKCPACRHLYTPHELQQAHARMLWRPEAERWTRLPEALATLKAQGRAERTIRRWLAPHLELVDRCTECAAIHDHQEHPACPAVVKDEDGNEDTCGGILAERWHGDAEAIVEAWCDIATRTTWVWWPDLWRLHLATRTTPRPSLTA